MAQVDEPGADERHQGLECVSDAYVRWSDVLFHWTKVLEERYANALKSIVDGQALTHPDSPLRLPGEDGITLYIGTDYIGKPRLLFSLKQIQYVQYYIHNYHLASPMWCQYYARHAELLAEEDGQIKAAELERPPEEEGQDDWVPLPNAICRASEFTKIIPFVFKSGPALSRAFKFLDTEGRQSERHYREHKTQYVFDPLKLIAHEDNNTEGPGLRRGPPKQREGRPNREDDERPDGVGWGGFPFMSREDNEESRAYGEGNQSIQYPAEGSGPETPGDSSTGLSTPISPGLGADYHYDCQQALILAAQGGLASALAVSDQQAENTTSDNPPEAIGRSLFLALSVTTWEKDPDVVLEVGWAGIWWQKKPGSEQNQGQEGFDEMRERGHYIIQDHLLDKRNGEVKPDFRDNYLYGNSLPITRDKLKPAFKQKIKDLSIRAGQGPIYLLVHAPGPRELDLTIFKNIGVGTSSVHADLQPEGWVAAPYICAAGCGSVFLINTATLFGAIEGPTSSPISPAARVPRTKKSLQHVALVMFGQEGARVPEKCGNAGNDAFYTLEVFLAIISGPPLLELKEYYRRTVLEQEARLAAIRLRQQQPPTANGEASVVQTVPLTGLVGNTPNHTTLVSKSGEHAEEAAEAQSNDDESEDDDNIGGVFYEDEEGNLVAVDAEDDDY